MQVIAHLALLLQVKEPIILEVRHAPVMLDIMIVEVQLVRYVIILVLHVRREGQINARPVIRMLNYVQLDASRGL